MNDTSITDPEAIAGVLFAIALCMWLGFPVGGSPLPTSMPASKK